MNFCTTICTHQLQNINHASSRCIHPYMFERYIRAWHDGDHDLRRTVEVWSELPEGLSPAARGEAIARRIYATRDDIGRELAALRAVQSLSVLDVRNYRKLVFDLGDYASEGEDPQLAEALP